jgi:hypothetical protein
MIRNTNMAILEDSDGNSAKTIIFETFKHASMPTRTFPWKILIWVTIFATAMGFLETAVVVYMRALLYPNGFAFPLAPIPPALAITEILREAATLVMLLGAGVLAGRNVASRFAWFLYAFAVWDIFYYVFLKLLLNWPESFMTWDILFLIPTTWVGPVISPVVVSCTMILLALLIIRFDSANTYARLSVWEWLWLVLGSVVLILSFCWDYSGFILEHYRFTDIWSIPSDELLKLALEYVPRRFNWFLFGLGEAIILAGIVVYWRRNKKIRDAGNS